MTSLVPYIFYPLPARVPNFNLDPYFSYPLPARSKLEPCTLYMYLLFPPHAFQI